MMFKSLRLGPCRTGVPHTCHTTLSHMAALFAGVASVTVLARLPTSRDMFPSQSRCSCSLRGPRWFPDFLQPLSLLSDSTCHPHMVPDAAGGPARAPCATRPEDKGPLAAPQVAQGTDGTAPPLRHGGPP